MMDLPTELSVAFRDLDTAIGDVMFHCRLLRGKLDKLKQVNAKLIEGVTAFEAIQRARLQEKIDSLDPPAKERVLEILTLD